MTSTEADANQSSLSQVFDRGLAIQEELEKSTEDTSSPAFQDKLRRGILMLEDATRLVSVLDMFSRNENFKEVPTEHLKYFLLPVLLGDLNSRLAEGAREDIVEACQIYYIDFLQRMVDYELTELKVPRLKEMKGEEEEAQTAPRIPDLAKMNAERDLKMQRFREKKDLEKEIGRLKELVAGATRDEDLERQLYINMLKRFIHIAHDELQSLQMEVDILRHMAAVKAGRVAEEPSKKSRPFQPVIITKDKMQKEVYGLGYPSLPVLSVDEFYDQRVREGWFPPPGSGQSLQDNALNPEQAAQAEEEHTREQEAKEEQDDEEELQRKRAMDEWKDEHRRGEGNRKNMG